MRCTEEALEYPLTLFSLTQMVNTLNKKKKKEKEKPDIDILTCYHISMTMSVLPSHMLLASSSSSSSDRFCTNPNGLIYLFIGKK